MCPFHVNTASGCETFKRSQPNMYGRSATTTNGWALCIIVLWQFHELIAQFMTLIFHFAKLRSRSVEQHSFPFVNLAKKSLQIIVLWSNLKPVNSFKKLQDVWCEFDVLSDALETYHVRGLKIQPLLNLTRICRRLIKKYFLGLVSTHVVCKRLSATQEQVRLPEFLAPPKSPLPPSPRQLGCVETNRCF